MTKKTSVSLFLVCIVFVTIAGILLHSAGTFLVLDHPTRSDIIVVLSGDTGDARFLRALNLLQSGYSQELILDAPDWIEYGRTSSDLAREYIHTIAPEYTSHLHVCSFNGDSTVLELGEVSKCVHAVAPSAKTAILVTSDFHTRRALSVAQHVLPEYRWSVAAAPDVRFSAAWWQHREWAKTTLTEWQKLCWWAMIDQYKAL
ncbi:MAG: YdcF family protein [Acidobacteriaceae bacterium]